MSVPKLIESLASASAADRGQMRINADRWLATGTNKQKAAAQAIVEAIDRHEAQAGQAFHDRVQGMTPGERVLAACAALPPTPADVKAVRALLDHPNATTAELSVVCGWKGNKWLQQFSKLGSRWGAYLWPDEPDAEPRDPSFYRSLLADLDETSNRFVMRAEAADALAGFLAGPKPKSRVA